jgi:uncharacterized protein YyaL (SSP411 family)
MDTTTYSDDKVAHLIENRFIPIRVDRDRRPDIDRRYNMGGWPTTAILTSDGEALTGATYVPPEQMRKWLEEVDDYYKKHKHTLPTKFSRLPESSTPPSTTDEQLDQDLLQSVIDRLTSEITSRFDPVHGGFGGAPKFPQSDALALSILEHHLQGHAALLNIATKTLQEMATGGIHDVVEGGFFRYSTTRDWSVPHYEKMCEDQARLLVNYVEAYQVTKQEAFRRTAQRILRYVQTSLMDPDGGFYGSQDADEKYYLLGLAKRKVRDPPKTDKTIYTNWNAEMISAFLLAAAVLEQAAYQRIALQAIHVLLEKCYSPAAGMQHAHPARGEPRQGLLTDQTHMARCLIDAYQTTADRRYVNYAEKLAVFMLDRLTDESGGFRDRPSDRDALGALKVPTKPFDENSVAAEVLLRLYFLTGRMKYRHSAKKTLTHLAHRHADLGLNAAAYGLAVELYRLPHQIHIVGQKLATKPFLGESLRAYNPLKTIEVLNPEADHERLRFLSYPTSNKPIAYVCKRGTCVAVEDPKQVLREVSILRNTSRGRPQVGN